MEFASAHRLFVFAARYARIAEFAALTLAKGKGAHSSRRGRYTPQFHHGTPAYKYTSL